MLAPVWSHAAADAGGEPEAPRALDRMPDGEPYATGWSFYIDNDYFSFGLSDDEGYTGGFALSLAGRRAVESPWSLDPVLGWVDGATGWDALYAGQPQVVRHSWQIGTVAFTPGDIDLAEPIPEDRPYAGLVFIGNTRQVRLQQRPVSYLSSFAFGVLGTGIPKSIQNGLHDLADDDKARGWDNQISDGGEPTFLWEVQRTQAHWTRRSPQHLDYELNSVLGASIGYSTKLSAGLTGRWGEFSSPWWRYNPAYAEFINLGSPSGTAGSRELYLWAGFHVHQQIYNAMLEGQFRDSEVTFDRPGDLESSLWEVNLGATWGMANGYHLTLAVRARENELRHGDASDAWGSLILGRQF